MGELHASELEARLTVGEAVQTYRLARKLSARRLSLQSGLSESYVGKLEAGQIECSLRAFASIATTLRMKPGEVYTIVVAEANVWCDQ